uniref:Uncharacterized protein n=1 Tax=Acrobeloides nanus TaxID=290746 RepID=A0A914E2S3_9BILA
MASKIIIFLTVILLPLTNANLIDEFKDMVSKACGDVSCPDLGYWENVVYTYCCNLDDNIYNIYCCFWPYNWVFVAVGGFILVSCCFCALSCCC